MQNSSGKTSTVRNAINSHCSHPLMLGMNWPGKLITTQESIHDTEGAVMLLCIAHQRVSAESLGICLHTRSERRGRAQAAKSPQWEFPSKLSHIDTLNYVSRQPELTASTPRSATALHAPVWLLYQTCCQQGIRLIFCNHLYTNSAANDSPAFHSQL